MLKSVKVVNDITDCILVIIAALAALIAFKARMDSKKSALAAEASAEQASKATKIARAGLLADDFHNIAYILDVISEEVGIIQDKRQKAFSSLERLKSFIPDQEFIKLLDSLPSLFKCAEEDSFSVFIEPIVQQKKENPDIANMRKVLNDTKLKYLRIE